MQQTTVFRNKWGTFVNDPTSSETTGTPSYASYKFRKTWDTFLCQPTGSGRTEALSRDSPNLQRQMGHSQSPAYRFRTNWDPSVLQPTGSGTTEALFCASPMFRNKWGTYIRRLKNPKTIGTLSCASLVVQEQLGHLHSPA
jgi:hypothetical protein